MSTSSFTGTVGAAVIQALERRAMTPVYQPVLHLRTGELAGFEVLARWRHERFGSVPPSEFLPIVEEAGLLAAFTRHMVGTACTAAAAWPGSFWLAFNLEASQLADDDLPDLLANALRPTGFPAGRVLLEVTEDAFAADPDRAELVTGRLGELGFGLALSDVNCGSTLRPILSVPFALLKLEHDLVRAAAERADARRSVSGLLGLAGSLGVPVAATGIETEAQAEALRALGCGLGQGWLFGEALPDALASGIAAAPRSLVNSVPAAAGSRAGMGKSEEASCAAFAAMLDGLGIAACVFDAEDRTVLWNRTFLDFFPEHRNQVSPGEPYSQNLRRFYDGRLHGAERDNIERYVADGVLRHRAQSRPFTFHHRERRLRVASLPLPGGRARLWQHVPAQGGPTPDGPAANPCQASLGLAERLADGFAVLDRADRVIFANDEFLHLYGAAAPDQVIGLTLAEIVRRAWQRDAGDGGEQADPCRGTEFIDNARFVGAPFEVRMPGRQWRRVVERREPNGLGHSIHSDITALKSEQEDLRALRESLHAKNTELAMLAGTDGLTGVANRRRFGEKLAEAWSRAAAERAPVALLMIDVDHFKAVNDRYGHPCGDECLRQVAVSIGEVVPSPSDLVARYGGEEFAVILPGTDAAAAFAVAERLRQGVARDQALAFAVTVSVGCVAVHPGSGRVAGSAELIERADAALYRAKAAGRNRVEAG